MTMIVKSIQFQVSHFDYPCGSSKGSFARTKSSECWISIFLCMCLCTHVITYVDNKISLLLEYFVIITLVLTAGHQRGV